MTTFNFRGLPDCFVRMIRFFVLQVFWQTGAQVTGWWSAGKVPPAAIWLPTTAWFPTWYNCTNQPGYQPLPGFQPGTNLVQLYQPAWLPTTAWFPTWLSLKSASFDTAQNGNHQSNLFYASSFFLFLFISIFLSVSSNDSGFESLFDDPTNVSTAHDDIAFKPWNWILFTESQYFLKLNCAWYVRRG